MIQASTTTEGDTINGGHSDRDLVERLQRSEIFRDYHRAFEAATGLPLALRSAGSFQAPLHGSRHANSFCVLMMANNKTCSACLESQQRMEAQAIGRTATVECYAGLSDSAVPVRVGERVVGFLQTGQVLLRRPSEARFNAMLRQMKLKGMSGEAKPLKEAYFQSPFMDKHRYESILRLLSIFAEHLSSLSNQLMVTEASSESPTIAKARAFIAENLGDEISLGQVARAAGMSVYYFCKIFRKEKGLTFTEYLSRLRVETVKKMLLNPHKRISEAAYDAGFQSLSQFNRVFRHFVGETPSDFRDSLHKRGCGLVEQGRLTHAA
jgi:AraC-like DNA-binding protein/ligand-binding sensor protein